MPFEWPQKLIKARFKHPRNKSRLLDCTDYRQNVQDRKARRHGSGAERVNPLNKKIWQSLVEGNDPHQDGAASLFLPKANFPI